MGARGNALFPKLATKASAPALGSWEGLWRARGQVCLRNPDPFQEIRGVPSWFHKNPEENPLD